MVLLSLIFRRIFIETYFESPDEGAFSACPVAGLAKSATKLRSSSIKISVKFPTGGFCSLDFIEVTRTTSCPRCASPSAKGVKTFLWLAVEMGKYMRILAPFIAVIRVVNVRM